MPYKSTHDIIRERLLMAKGLLSIEVPRPKHTLEELESSEWSPEFEKLMRNRLIMGAIRYGKLHDENKPWYDRVPSVIRRVKAYEETGNIEHLVDAANECLLEFEESRHPNKHFASIDDGEHTKTKKIKVFSNETQ